MTRREVIVLKELQPQAPEWPLPQIARQLLISIREHALNRRKE
jgi:hypothetical protein